MRMRHGQMTIRSQTVSPLAPYSYRDQTNGISVCKAESKPYLLCTLECAFAFQMVEIRSSKQHLVRIDCMISTSWGYASTALEL